MRDLHMTGLEPQLRRWEDRCYTMATVGKALAPTSYKSHVAITGQIKNWNSLRGDLLNAGNNEFDYEKYHCPSGAKNLLGPFAFFPEMLHAWTKKSRRVYQLSEELQNMLEMTSLGGIFWDDLQFPFDSFAISLSKPIRNPTSQYEFNFLLVEVFKTGNENRLDILTFNRDIQYDPISEDEKAKFTKIIANRRMDLQRYVANIFDYGMKLENEHFKSTKNDGLYFASSDLSSRSKHTIDTPTQDLVDIGVVHMQCIEADEHENVGKMDTASYEFLDKLDRIIAGLMLYFNTLPTSNYNKLEWVPGSIQGTTSRENELECIANESLVCAVAYDDNCNHENGSSAHRTDERKRSSGWTHGSYEHPGYWRRVRGAGPGAPRTKWVKPYKVHPELQQDGMIPVGLEQRI